MQLAENFTGSLPLCHQINPLIIQTNQKTDEAKVAFKNASTFSDEPGYKAYSTACFLYLDGKQELALAELNKAITLDERNKERALINVEVFGPLSADPAFKKLTE